jgi:3-isopropylmalate/(R)-2-methylmalate dehydratase small subunit
VAVECPDAVDAVQDGGEVLVDYTAGTVTIGQESFAFAPYPPGLTVILEAGGLIPYLMQQAEAGHRG